MYPEIEVASLDGFNDKIDPLLPLGGDHTFQGLYPYLALFKIGRGDFEGGVMIASIDQLQFPAEEFIGVVDIALVDLTQVDCCAG